MISFRTLRCEPRKLEGKLNVVRIGIRESKRACGEAVSCGSAFPGFADRGGEAKNGPAGPS